MVVLVITIVVFVSITDAVFMSITDAVFVSITKTVIVSVVQSTIMFVSLIQLFACQQNRPTAETSLWNHSSQSRSKLSS